MSRVVRDEVSPLMTRKTTPPIMASAEPIMNRMLQKYPSETRSPSGEAATAALQFGQP
jgi:hypothetical protein